MSVFKQIFLVFDKNVLQLLVKTSKLIWEIVVVYNRGTDFFLSFKFKNLSEFAFINYSYFLSIF